MASMLAENWSQSGTDKAVFFDLCKKVDENTAYIPVTSPELRSFDCADAANLNYGVSTVLSKSTLAAEGVDDIFDELKASKAPLMAANGEVLFSNNRAVAEIANLRGLHGSALVKPSKKRDAFITELADGVKMTAVVRRQGAVGKVLSIRSDKYQAIPLKEMEEILYGFLDNDVIGKYKVIGWEMDQDTAILQLEFPDIGDDIKDMYPDIKDTWYPGVYFKSGTTGYTPVSVEMYYRRVDSNGNISEPVFAGRAYAKHFAAFNKAAFIKKVQDDIWGRYLQMPDKLNAFAQVIYAQAELETIIKKIFSFIKLNKVFQKKDTETCRYLDKLWESALTQAKNIANIQVVTLYDIVNIVMDLPDRITVPAAYADLLRETCGRAWTYDI